MPSELETPFAVDFAAPDDGAAMTRVFRDAFSFYVWKTGRRPPPMDRDYARLIEDHFVLKLTERGDSVGFAALLPRRRALYIDAIAIAPQRQRMGGGSLLLARTERLASELCLTTVQLHTPARAGPLAFYRALGYRETNREGRGAHAYARFEKSIRTALDDLLGA